MDLYKDRIKNRAGIIPETYTFTKAMELMFDHPRLRDLPYELKDFLNETAERADILPTMGHKERSELSWALMKHNGSLKLEDKTVENLIVKLGLEHTVKSL